MDEKMLQRLRETKSEAEWNATCDEVKKANNGGYPTDWFAKVILSGLAHEAQGNWR